MDLSQTLGPDGMYVMCFRSKGRPDYKTECNKFQPYGFMVRTDREKSWVFLRSPNLDDMHQCIEELGDTHNFRPVLNSYKHKDFPAKNQRDDPAKQANDALYGTTEVIGLHEVIVMNLPDSFTTDRIRDMCRLVYVTPIQVVKRFTRQGRAYCSVCFKSGDGVKKMCSTLNGVKYDDKYIIVKDARDLA